MILLARLAGADLRSSPPQRGAEGAPGGPLCREAPTAAKPSIGLFGV
jgi:hypothetical protein